MKDLMATLATVALFAGSISAADVSVRLSTREAYVGAPITLQIAISNASDFDPPQIPAIDGCDVREVGSPSQSSQVTIINGRRTESRSVTMRYLITPRREGTFEIPAFTLEVDGEEMRVPAQRFIATKSDTGDLLFVEIEGGKDRVYVGQPLDLKLKIWLKPFRDSERNLTLSEADMWNMISPQSSWGSFSERMKELAKNNQRPGGEEVLREDGQGNQRSYYLYEIDATVYPKRAGNIDGSDVHILVDYPTALGESRSPFGSMFDDPFGGSVFGGSSPLSRMMDDEFFGSPFGRRLAVTATRPIVGDVSVDATDVIPVPSEGRPANYRGAVGRYRIVTQATPTTVDAGDPITLNIGIAGTGPMELVQAPPLSELAALTADFKVADQSLAGFVQDDSKVFSTTIRPKREGITEIPAIPFSFFDPETETFETVTSEPIAITVNKSEMLSLDSIVGPHKPSGNATAPAASPQQPDFANSDSGNLLVSETRVAESRTWLAFLLLPPLVWLVTWLACNRSKFSRWLPVLRSARVRCLTAISRASDRDSIGHALTSFISRRTGRVCKTQVEAIGALRLAGAATLANEVEIYFDRLAKENFEPSEHEDALQTPREQGMQLTQKIDKELTTLKQVRPRLTKRSAKPLLGGSHQRSLGLLLALAVALSTSQLTAAESVQLTQAQQEVVLSEATEAYNRGLELAGSDAPTAKEHLQTAARKYELLVESGIRNAGIFANLGNTYLQSGELGRAIANYERALQFDPGRRQVATNLDYAYSLVEGRMQSEKAVNVSFGSLLQMLQSGNASLVQLLGTRALLWTLALASILFWGLLTTRTLGYRFPVWRFAALPGLLMIIALASWMLVRSQARSAPDAVVVTDQLILYTGDGEQFEKVLTIETSQGHPVNVLTGRGRWKQISTADGHTGWVPSQSLELIGV